MFIEDLPQILPTQFGFIWLSNFRRKYLQKSTNQKQELPVVTMFVNGSGQNAQSLQRIFHRFFLPRFGSFDQAVSEKILKYQPIRNMNFLWWPCLLTYTKCMDEICNLYSGPSTDSSYLVLVHLSKKFQKKIFKKIDQLETIIACGGHVC